MGSGTLSFYWYGRLFFSVVSFYYMFYLFPSLRFQLFHQRKKKVGRTRLKETIENKINMLSLDEDWIFFVSLGLYIGIFIIILVWKLGKYEKLVKKIFYRAFLGTQLANT